MLVLRVWITPRPCATTSRPSMLTRGNRCAWAAGGDSPDDGRGLAGGRRARVWNQRLFRRSLKERFPRLIFAVISSLMSEENIKVKRESSALYGLAFVAFLFAIFIALGVGTYVAVLSLGSTPPQPAGNDARIILAAERSADAAVLAVLVSVATTLITATGTFFIWRQVALTTQAVRDTSRGTAAMENRMSWLSKIGALGCKLKASP